MINIGTEGILDDPEEAGNNNEPVWVDAGRKPVVEDFLVNDPGPSNEAKKAESELDCFNLFFDQLYQLIIEQTNLYAEQNNRDFAPITKIELQKYMGLSMLTGLIKKPSIKS